MGRGLKPEWATKGIDFLYFAANPTFTKFLSDDEFEVRVPMIGKYSQALNA